MNLYELKNKVTQTHFLCGSRASNTGTGLSEKNA